MLHLALQQIFQVIAAQTLDASSKALDKVARDSGVRYTFYLLTQVALASRTSKWEDALADHGIHVTSDSTVFDLTVEIQGAIDRYLRRGPSVSPHPKRDGSAICG